MENLDLMNGTVEAKTEELPVPDSSIRKTFGKTTYVANLCFKEQGQTFSQKLKRVLRAENNAN